MFTSFPDCFFWTEEYMLLIIKALITVPGSHNAISFHTEELKLDIFVICVFLNENLLTIKFRIPSY